MPLRELVLPQQGQYLRAVAQQPQLVRHGALTFTHTLGRLLLTQTIQAHEPRQPLGLLDVVEVAPLKVLHQRDHAALRLVHRQQDAGHLPKPRHPRGAQAALACDQLIESVPPPDGQRLHDAVFRNARRQLLQPRRVEDLPRLARIRPDLCGRKI